MFRDLELEELRRLLEIGEQHTRPGTRRETRQPTRVGQEILPGYLSHLQPEMETPPQAIERTGALRQFAHGIGSPVTSTLAKIMETGALGNHAKDVLAPRVRIPDPQTTGENIANMLGSMIGYTALLSIGLIKAPVAAASTGIAKILGGSKFAGAVAKGATVGGMLGTHRSLTSPEPVTVERLSKDALTSVAFGAALGGGSHAAGKALMKMGITNPDTFHKLKQQYAGKLMHTGEPDRATAEAIMSSSRQGGFLKAVSNQVPGVSKRTLTGKTSKEDWMKVWVGKKQRVAAEKLWEADSFGKQYDAYKQLAKLRSRHPGRIDAVNTVKEEVHAQVGRIFQGKIELPQLRDVTAKIQSEHSWSYIQDWTKNLTYKEMVDNSSWHPKVQELFSRFAGKQGQSLSGMTMEQIRKFLGGKKAPAWLNFKKEYDTLIKELATRGEGPQVFHTSMYSFPIPGDYVSPVAKKAWIQGSKEFASLSAEGPISYYDVALLQKPPNVLSWLTNIITPLRGIFGLGPANMKRTAVHGKMSYDNRMGIVQVGKFMKELHPKDLKVADKSGEPIQKVLYGFFSKETDTAIAKYVPNLITGKGFKYKDVVRDIGLTKVMSEKGAIEYLKKTVAAGKNYIKSPEMQDMLMQMNKGRWKNVVTEETILSQFVRRGLLRKAGPKATDELAKMFGLSNAKELSVAYKMHMHYDKLFRDSGLDPMRQLAMYAPMTRKAHAGGMGVDTLLKDFDRIGKKGMHEGYMWANELMRKGQGEFVNVEMNAFKAMLKYVDGLSKSKFYRPLFEHMNKIMKDADPSKKALWTRLQEHMKGVPSEMDANFDRAVYGFLNALGKQKWSEALGPKPWAQLSSLLAELQIYGGLGLNPFAAFRNLTQKGLALSSITPDGNPLHGLKYMAKAQAFKKTAAGKNLLTACKVRDNPQFHESLDAQQSAITSIAKRMGKSHFIKATDKAQKGMMAMFKKSDMSNVEDTFLAKMMYELGQGRSFAAAANSANNLTALTQFMYGFDSPMLYKSTGPLGSWGKQLGVFMSWPMNWAHMLVTQGSQGEVQKALSTITTMAVLSEIMTLSGFNFTSIHPVTTARSALPIALAEGQERWPMALRSGALGLEAIRALARGDHAAVDRAMSNFAQRMWLLVPAGHLPRKAIETIHLAQNDWRKYDKRDRLVYNIDTEQGLFAPHLPGEVGRSLIGPTVEAQQRFDDWQQVSRMDASYKHLRGLAVMAFMEGDYDEFQRYQEQLVINFGRWIEPKDIKYEMRLREMTARQRQLIGMPSSIRDEFLKELQVSR